jgi:hypothetical protein
VSAVNEAQACCGVNVLQQIPFPVFVLKFYILPTKKYLPTLPNLFLMQQFSASETNL